MLAHRWGARYAIDPTSEGTLADEQQTLDLYMEEFEERCRVNASNNADPEEHLTRRARACMNLVKNVDATGLNSAAIAMVEIALADLTELHNSALVNQTIAHWEAQKVWIVARAAVDLPETEQMRTYLIETGFDEFVETRLEDERFFEVSPSDEGLTAITSGLEYAQRYFDPERANRLTRTIFERLDANLGDGTDLSCLDEDVLDIDAFSEALFSGQRFGYTYRNGEVIAFCDPEFDAFKTIVQLHTDGLLSVIDDGAVFRTLFRLAKAPLPITSNSGMIGRDMAFLRLCPEAMARGPLTVDRSSPFARIVLSACAESAERTLDRVLLMENMQNTEILNFYYQLYFNFAWSISDPAELFVKLGEWEARVSRDNQYCSQCDEFRSVIRSRLGTDQ